MRIKRSDEQRLIVVHFPLMLAVLGLLPALLPVYAVVHIIEGKALFQNVPPTWTQQLLGVLLAVLMAVVWGAMFSFFVNKSTFDFDLVRRQLTWSRRSIYRKKGGTVPFEQIEGALVEIFSSSDGPSYRPALATNQGTLPLMSYFTGGKFTAREYERIVAVINSALQTNPASAMEDEILNLVSSGQRLAAIQKTRQRYGYDLTQASEFVEALMKRSST